MDFADSLRETARQKARAVSSEITLGRPLGGCRSSMSPALARGLYICTVALLTIATVLALAVPAWAVEVDLDNYTGQLHWVQERQEAVMDPTLGSVTSYNVVWYIADASGQKVDSLRKGGKDVDLGENHRLASKDGNGDAGPGVWAYANVPAGSSVQPPTSVPGVDGAVSSRVIQLIDRNAQDNNGQDSTSPGTDSMGNESASSKFNWDSPIESTDVTVDLAHLDHILPSFLKCIYQFILAPLIRLAAGLCQWLLKLVDPSKMVDGNFSGGTYKELYATATKINDNVAVPYAKTFIMIVFLVSLLDPGRPRSHDGTPEFIDGFLRRLALLFLAWVFVENALTIVEFIYWLGGNAVTKIVELLGGASGFTEMGTAIQTSVDSTLASVKFSEYYIVLFLLLVMFAVLMSVFKCVQKIIVVMLLRAGEIYLRASMAALPFAFFAGERQRMVGMNYMKRFLAVCFQAVVIVVALSFMGVIFTTSSTIISGLIGQASESVPGMTAAATVAQAVLPTVVSVACATAIVDKSDAVANSMFGM